MAAAAFAAADIISQYQTGVKHNILMGEGFTIIKEVVDVEANRV
jgi:hypothetical protein